jgi:hypothetical protein
LQPERVQQSVPKTKLVVLLCSSPAYFLFQIRYPTFHKEDGNETKSDRYEMVYRYDVLKYILCSMGGASPFIIYKQTLLSTADKKKARQ